MLFTGRIQQCVPFSVIIFILKTRRRLLCSSENCWFDYAQRCTLKPYIVTVVYVNNRASHQIAMSRHICIYQTLLLTNVITHLCHRIYRMAMPVQLWIKNALPLSENHFIDKKIWERTRNYMHKTLSTLSVRYFILIMCELRMHSDVVWCILGTKMCILNGQVCAISRQISKLNNNYHQVSNIRRTLVGNKIVDHSDVVGASPVGAAPTTSSFST